VVFGPYETYDDGIMGYKASFEAFLCVEDAAESEKLAKYKGEISWLESSLPIPDEHKNPNRGATVPIKVVDQSLCDGPGGHHDHRFNLPNDERVREAKGFKNVLLRNVMLAKYDAILVPIAERVLPPELAMSLSPNRVRQLRPVPRDQPAAWGRGRSRGTARRPRCARSCASCTRRSRRPRRTSCRSTCRSCSPTRACWRRRDGVGAQTFVAGLFRTARFGVSEAHGQGVWCKVNYLMEKGAIVVTAEGRFAPVADKFFDAVRDLAHDLLMLQALGDYDGAKAFVEKYGKVVPEAMNPADRVLGAGLPWTSRPLYQEF